MILKEGYYLDNFFAVLDTVEDHDKDLLDDNERRFSQDFRALDLGAQRLYVRLISRRGPIFRRDRLAYAEIPMLDQALQALRCAGFVDAAEDAPLDELVSLLLRSEIQQLADALLPTPPTKSSRKDIFLQALLQAVEVGVLEPETLEDHVRRQIEIIRPLRHEVLLVFRLLYFGNLGQDWTEFVLRDLGVVCFEPYEMRRELRRFDSRQAIDDTLSVRLLHQEAYDRMVHGDTDGALAVAQQVIDLEASWHPITERKRQALLLAMARQLERQDALDDALSLYTHVPTPPSRERRARVLERQGHLGQAIRLCETMVEDPQDETEAVFAPRFAHQLRRKQGESLGPWRRPKRPQRKLGLPRRHGVAVEQQALDALQLEGIDGFFAENWLWKSLFGLAFWDIVFAPIAGAFQHAFQYGPLDQHSTDFRARRRALIEDRLEELRQSEDLASRLLPVFDRKQGTANRWVAWHTNARPYLQAALGRLDGTYLAAICDRLSRHPGRYRRGFPDLFVWSQDAPGFSLLEVKAPGDQLRPEQGAWIDYLNGLGIDCRILHLEWTST